MSERELPWVPASFVKAARKMDFMTEFDDVPFLLVRIDDPAGELAAGLAATSTLGDYAIDAGSSLGMSTVAVDTNTILEQMRRSQGSGLEQAGNAQIPSEMLARCYFVVPLRKRATEEATVMRERISVGRTRNHDIVLRDRSVSKFHAYFQIEEDTVFISDAGSKNGSRVGSEKVTSARTQVAPGAVVTIGSIEVVLCTADALWDVLKS
jgi:hypothetical protein